MKNSKNIIIAFIGILLVGATLWVLSAKFPLENTEDADFPSQEAAGQAPENKGAPKEMDYATIAQKLGLAEADVKAALTPETGKRVDFQQASTKLGVTPEVLMEALGMPQRDDKKSPKPAEDTTTDTTEATE